MCSASRWKLWLITVQPRVCAAQVMAARSMLLAECRLQPAGRRVAVRLRLQGGVDPVDDRVGVDGRALGVREQGPERRT